MGDQGQVNKDWPKPSLRNCEIKSYQWDVLLAIAPVSTTSLGV